MSSEVESADLIVLSHLRWDWVWQRPQHLISRLSRDRHTWFVEEPRHGDVTSPQLVTQDAGCVTRVWLELPPEEAVNAWSTPQTAWVAPLMDELLGPATPRDVWLYAPTAVQVARALHPRVLVYDVMDDLASFADAPPEMELRMRLALDIADIAFAGGPSLYRSAASVRGESRTRLYPSGVECEHYERSRDLRTSHPRPVVGYVGVIDERLDLDLLAGLATALPEWDVQMVGPVTKIDPATLPQAPNLHYLGMKAYDELPAVMAGFDVAMMPFALNEATRSISPTKTLEYLAAGLPVVSTRVPDVVSEWGSVVHLVDDAQETATACAHVLTHDAAARDARLAPLRRRHEWDAIAAAMRGDLEDLLAARAARAETTTLSGIA
ncbi:MAG TPA: glycosyltransferase [Mycobacteriales bacterium]|nr:glycosyltransferase [Mycobacteriales bacterium]